MASKKTIAKGIFILIVFILLTMAALWIAGFLILFFCKKNPIGNTDLKTWIEVWAHQRHDPFIEKRIYKALLFGCGIAYGIPGYLVLQTKSKGRPLHGDAKFADGREIKKSGLLEGHEGSLIIGKIKIGSEWHYLFLPRNRFAFLAAKTRSYKTVAIIIPNLLNFAHSIVAMDFKDELYRLTAGYRQKHGQKVFAFNPFTLWTHRYNPLTYVRDEPFRIADLKIIAEIFYPDGGKDAFWHLQAQNLFIGMALLVFETPDLPRTIGEMYRQSAGKGQDIKKHLETIIKHRNFVETNEKDPITNESKLIPRKWDGTGLKPLSMECVDALNQFLNTSDNTRSSILASFNAPLLNWRNPIFDAATAESDFDLRKVRSELMSIYICITPNNLPVADRIINLFFSQLISLNIQELPENNPNLKYTCALINDEFAAPGCIKVLDKTNGYMAGYGLSMLNSLQSPAQAEAPYPDGYGATGARTLISNHSAQILFAPGDQKTAEEYSRMLGTETVKATSKNRQLGWSKGGSSESESEQRRDLLNPQEIKEIGVFKQIIVYENNRPIQCDKIIYFEESEFVNRLKSVSPFLKSVEGIPTQEQLLTAVRNNELAPLPPKLDIDLHKAKVEHRTRPITKEEFENGIDLKRVANAQPQVPIPKGEIDKAASEGIAKAYLSRLFKPSEGASAYTKLQRTPPTQAKKMKQAVRSDLKVSNDPVLESFFVVPTVTSDETKSDRTINPI